MRKLAVVGTLVLLAACRGEPRASSEDQALARTIDSLIPGVEQATGLTFKRHPRARMVDRSEVTAYLLQNLDKEYGSDRGRHLLRSYQLFGLLPDTVDLKSLLVSVLTEQVAGYYDPDSGAFFGVRGGNSAVFNTTVAHELVHALQHDYVRLDSVEQDLSDADRRLAAHSVLEGQATLAMMRMNPQVGDRALTVEFWDEVREQTRMQAAQMPQISAAPRLIREALTFPYFAGAEYMRWWMTTHPAGEQPYGAAMPQSSEEILAPERVARGDKRVYVTFVGGDSAVYGDLLGAMEIRVLLAQARGQEGLADPAVLGWGGDRFELYDTPKGEALVWIIVFDSPPARESAARALAQWPPKRAKYRSDLAKLEVSGKAALRLTVAPEGWSRWSSLPNAVASTQSP